jgi:hypothetical protein
VEGGTWVGLLVHLATIGQDYENLAKDGVQVAQRRAKALPSCGLNAVDH